jgi:hypothetical protein
MGRRQAFPTWPGINALRAANSMEGMPQRAQLKLAFAEVPITVRIRRRTEAITASDPSILADGTASIIGTSPPRGSTAQAITEDLRVGGLPPTVPARSRIYPSGPGRRSRNAMRWSGNGRSRKRVSIDLGSSCQCVAQPPAPVSIWGPDNPPQFPPKAAVTRPRDRGADQVAAVCPQRRLHTAAVNEPVTSCNLHPLNKLSDFSSRIRDS